jgi:hypothetical protein
MPKLKKSEFEGNGPLPFGGDGMIKAHEKLLIIKRTEQDPEGTVDMKAKADQFEKGGVPRDTSSDDWSQFVE